MRRAIFPLVLIFLFPGTLLTPALAGDFPVVEGWAPHGDARTFTSDNLWEYINGGADNFLAYGFRELISRDLKAGDLTATVDIYDMGSRLNAFGIYKSECNSSAVELDAGITAQVSPPYQGLLLKDAYDAKIHAFEGEIGEENGAALMTAIAAALPGSDELPEEIQALPALGRIAGSEAYERQNYLGLGDLDQCVHARYTLDDQAEYQVFLVIPRGEKAIAATWQRLVTRWKSKRHRKTDVLYKNVPYTGFVGVTRAEAGLIGVAGLEELGELLDRLHETVKQ